jgi:hypothetical protein
MTDDTLQRFFHALVEALSERSPSDLERPFTVAEIYQDLVPYRTHRDQLGVEMNGDYEHALLRLLAGEGGYLALESEHALRDIRDELGEKSPNTTLYRDYAAVDVKIEPAVLNAVGGRIEEVTPEPSEAEVLQAEDVEDEAGTPPSAAPIEAEVDEVEPTEVEPAEVVVAVEEPAPVFEAAAPAPTANGSDDGHCAWCRSDLPTGRTVLYCPYCGQDQSLLPCRSCGEALESDWRFCITCGAQAAS